MMHLTAACILLCHFQIWLLYIDMRFDIKYHKIVAYKLHQYQTSKTLQNTFIASSCAMICQRSTLSIDGCPAYFWICL